MSDTAVMLRHLALRAALALRDIPRRIVREVDFLRRGIHVARGTLIERGTCIGRRTRINAVSHIGRCEIGAYCAIGGRLVVRSANHETAFLNMQGFAQTHFLRVGKSVIGVRKGDVVIGNGVWIGDSVIILPGVRIGNGAIIGAGAVVTRSVPDFAVAVGNPARMIRMRFSPALCEALSSIQWWDWDDARIKSNRWLFETDLAQGDEASILAALRDIAP